MNDDELVQHVERVAAEFHAHAAAAKKRAKSSDELVELARRVRAHQDAAAPLSGPAELHFRPADEIAAMTHEATLDAIGTQRGPPARARTTPARARGADVEDQDEHDDGRDVEDAATRRRRVP